MDFLKNFLNHRQISSYSSYKKKIGNNNYSFFCKDLLVLFFIILFFSFNSSSYSPFIKLNLFSSVAYTLIYIFFILKEKFSYLILFILGIFADIYMLSPIGLTSFSLLVVSKFFEKYLKFIFKDNIFHHFFGCEIFILLCFLIKFLLITVIFRKNNIYFFIKDYTIISIINIILFCLFLKKKKK